MGMCTDMYLLKLVLEGTGLALRIALGLERLQELGLHLRAMISYGMSVLITNIQLLAIDACPRRYSCGRVVMYLWLGTAQWGNSSPSIVMAV